MIQDGLVLFATGSSIAVEYAATCRRLGLAIAAGISNREGPSYLPEAVAIVSAAAIPPALLSCPWLCPLFSPANRRVAVREAVELGFDSPRSLVDPTAIVADDLEMGGGSFVNAGVIVGAATSFGAHVVVNRGASIGHHVRLDDIASIGPGAILAGHVRVGAGAMIGAGAIILPGLAIGEGAVVGAGSVVTRDVEAGGKVMGAAARPVGSGAGQAAGASERIAP
jgi:sugar O-acyltransferase (sialic acid O-acetyltransferase NeuD family)